ncbi:MAG: hypothetical protein AAB370_05780 [Verrucomicrobiota bacterium]
MNSGLVDQPGHNRPMPIYDCAISAGSMPRRKIFAERISSMRLKQRLQGFYAPTFLGEVMIAREIALTRLLLFSRREQNDSPSCA